VTRPRPVLLDLARRFRNRRGPKPRSTYSGYFTDPFGHLWEIIWNPDMPNTLGVDDPRKEAAMADLLIDFITSLDGYAAAEGWPGWWGLQGPEYLAWLGEQPEGDYTVLMGANTYRLMSQFAAQGEPGTGGLASMSKIVFSTTLREPLSWPNTRLVADDPVEVVRAMKKDGSKSMRTLGSLTLCRALLKAGLVDRFRVVVFPVITGRTGRERIYDGYPDLALEMIGSRTFDGRIQLLEYVPTILAGPPEAPRATRNEARPPRG
jgi:dihydrofolate reductase